MATADELTALALARRERRALLALAARLAAARFWRRMDPARLTQTWDSEGRSLVLGVSTLQLKAAQGADTYVAKAMRLQGFDVDFDGELVPGSLAGVASDGRTLSGLFRQAVLDTQGHLAGGVAEREAMEAGLRQLQLMVETQVIDAGRVADGVATNANRRSRSGGYVRVLTPPSCGRCAILAGRIYSSDRAFQRHPRCDCIHLPVGDTDTAKAMTVDVREMFNSMTRDQQAKAFTVAGAQAIRDGADPSQVVNARRGMYSASSGLRLTSAGARGGIRLMPEAIYEIANSKAEILRLLRRFGYLT